MPEGITLQEVTTAYGVSKRYTVLLNGRVIGILEKFKNTRTETHPWKAYHDFGLRCTWLGAFYKEDGGKNAAIKAIVEAWNA